MKFEKKTAAEIAAMSAEEQEQYLTAKAKHDADERQKEIDKALKPLTDNQEESDKDIQAIKDELTSMREQMKTTISPELKNTIYHVVKENFEAIKAGLIDNKDFKFTAKAAAIHATNNGTVSNADGLAFPASSFEVDNETAFIRTPANFILNVIRNSQREKVPATMLKTQQVAKEGAVAVVSEGGVKPLLQYKFQRTSTSRKKYAGRVEFTEEFDMDFDQLVDDIIEMFERDVITAWQDDLIAIMSANATSYIASSLDGTLVQPDNGLAVIAAQQQIAALGYNPNVVIMNPADIDSAIYTQDTNGNFQLKPYIDASGKRIGPMTIIPSIKMTAGEALLGDFTIYKEVHTGFIMRNGYYDDQFIKNERTVVGEVFSIMNAAPAQYPAVMKINLATVKAALKKA